MMMVAVASGICPGPYKPNCNIFEYNCVGCAYVFHKENQCTVNVYCSCFYCCDKKYAETCPDRCRGCILDGIGGCPENMLDPYKTIGNSSSSMPKSETKAWKAFNMIDVDKSGSISLNEAVKHLGSKPDNGTFAKHLAKNLSWFAEIDRNANNQIEPWEFDRSLIGTKIRQLEERLDRWKRRISRSRRKLRGTVQLADGRLADVSTRQWSTRRRRHVNSLTCQLADVHGGRLRQS
uniref:EF-hand domain-containing protein n=1 Tax=Globodera rostochiensis TaxID=31243 RepID=A0A914IH21_GLORO